MISPNLVYSSIFFSSKPGYLKFISVGNVRFIKKKKKVKEKEKGIYVLSHLVLSAVEMK